LRKKAFVGVLSTAMVSSMLIFPNLTHASGKINLADEIEQSYRIKTLQKLEHIVDQGNSSSTSTTRMKSMSMAEQTNSQVTFANKISFSDEHLYKIHLTSGGTIHVTAPDTQSADIFYAIIPVNAIDDPTYDPAGAYTDGDSLPAGDYYFVVGSASDTAQDYSFTVSGPAMVANTDLPNLSVTSPDKEDYRLSKTASGITVTGSATGASQTFYVVDMGDRNNFTGTSFNQTVSIPVGYHDLQIGAESSSGNMTIHDYAITHPGTIRLAGANRYEVSANISKENYPYGTDTVIVARGDLYTDALSGGPLATFYGAPVLLTTTTSLPAPIATEIQRLHATHAIILGGTGSVSTNVENQLQQMGLNTERLDGANRFEVSAKIGQRLVNEAPTDTAIIASGLNFPDALSASSPAGQAFMPILQVSSNQVPAPIDSFIQNNHIKNFIIVGGPGTISTAVEDKLKAYGGQVDRIGGSNRFEVGVNLINYFYDPDSGFMDPSTLVFANGLNFPDALSGGPLAANIGAPILLTQADKVDPTVKNFLEKTLPTMTSRDVIYILGGVGSVNTTVENYLKSIID
jgi:putative cell wall-binding protein